MASSYQKLKQKNNELLYQVEVLKNELKILVLTPNSYEALEIKSRVQFTEDNKVIESMLTRRRNKGLLKTMGFIPYLQHPRKIIQ